MKALKELRRYPTAIAGMIIMAIFVIVSIYTVIAIPYSEAIRLWRPGEVHIENPNRAGPVWYDWFTSDRLSRTFIVTLEDEGVIVTEEPIGDGMKLVEILVPFEYHYDRFPTELALVHRWTYETQRPLVSVSWRKPDGEVIALHPAREILHRDSFPVYYISQDGELSRVLGHMARPEERAPTLSPRVGLFARDITDRDRGPMQGRYELIVQAEMAEGDSVSEIRLRVYGEVHGWAGTDHRRRDISVALLWGAPIGLMFGIVAAVGAQVSTFILAGIGTWFGGKLDGAFQKATELTMILPNLAVLIMVAHLYDPSIYRILGIVIALNVFSASYKVYRAMFLQSKELPYIEASQAYGAGNFRIIFRYLLPRMMPILLPQFVIIIPSFVFLEATLAVLGLGDPVLPTWGKVLNDAYNTRALITGHYYWILQPALLLMFIGFGFAMVGFALDRVVNPKLRTV